MDSSNRPFSLGLKTLTPFQLFLLSQCAFAFFMLRPAEAKATKHSQGKALASPLNATSRVDSLNNPLNLCLPVQNSNPPSEFMSLAPLRLQGRVTEKSNMHFFCKKRKSSESLLLIQAENKEKNIEKVASKVCHEIHEKKFHLDNNPPGTILSTKGSRFFFDTPWNYNPFRNRVTMHFFRERVNELIEESWINFRVSIELSLCQLNLAKEIAPLVLDYIDNTLQRLNQLRVRSACVDAFKGTSLPISINYCYSTH